MTLDLTSQKLLWYAINLQTYGRSGVLRGYFLLVHEYILTNTRPKVSVWKRDDVRILVKIICEKSVADVSVFLP